jgi:hypothetical protein
MEFKEFDYDPEAYKTIPDIEWEINPKFRIALIRELTDDVITRNASKFKPDKRNKLFTLDDLMNHFIAVLETVTKIKGYCDNKKRNYDFPNSEEMKILKQQAYAAIMMGELDSPTYKPN